MPGNPGVVMLLQDPTAKVFVPRDNNLAEIKQPAFDMPFGRPGRPGSLGFKEVPSCEGQGFLKVRFAGERLSDVSQKGASGPATMMPSNAQIRNRVGLRSVTSVLSGPGP
jgi:hypothetical protein